MKNTKDGYYECLYKSKEDCDYLNSFVETKQYCIYDNLTGVIVYETI